MAAARSVIWATSFMPRWYPPGGPRSACVDDQQVRPRNGAPGDEDRSPERTRLDRARPDTPLTRTLQPAVEAARRVDVQRTRPLAVADERAGEPPLGRRLQQHDLLAGQAVSDAEPRPSA